MESNTDLKTKGIVANWQLTEIKKDPEASSYEAVLEKIKKEPPEFQEECISVAFEFTKEELDPLKVDSESVQNTQPDENEESNECRSCHLCEKKYKKNGYLHSHLHLIHGEKIFHCKFCPRTFLRESQLYDHMAFHLEEEAHRNEGNNRIPFCNICGKEYKHSVSLQSHLLLNHREDTANFRTKRGEGGRYSCHFCSKVYRCKASFHYHLQHHHGQKTYQCKICEVAFLHESNLRSHMTSHSEDSPDKNEENVETHTCHLCGKQYKFSASLQSHLQLVHGEKPFFRCRFCKTTFSYELELRSHMTSHSEDRPFKCRLCGRRYKNKVSLICHEKNHKSRYKCKDCGIIFFTKCDFDRHLEKASQGSCLK